jgi:hypothetical protein
MYARCDTCDTFRLFNLGVIATSADLLVAWARLNDLKALPCEGCGATRWDVSIRFGLVRAATLRDVLVPRPLEANSALTYH